MTRFEGTGRKSGKGQKQSARRAPTGQPLARRWQGGPPPGYPELRFEVLEARLCVDGPLALSSAGLALSMPAAIEAAPLAGPALTASSLALSPSSSAIDPALAVTTATPTNAAGGGLSAGGASAGALEADQDEQASSASAQLQAIAESLEALADEAPSSSPPMMALAPLVMQPLPSSMPQPIDSGVYDTTLAGFENLDAGFEMWNPTPPPQSMMMNSQGQEAPDTPTGVGATKASSSAINVQWNSQTDAACFTIERSSTGPASDFAAIGLVASDSTSYLDTTASEGATYYYRVIANGNGASSDPSNVVATTAAPAAPTGLRYSNNGDSIDLSWTVAAAAPGGHRLEVSTDAWDTVAGSYEYDPQTTSAHWGPATAGQTYYFRISTFQDGYDNGVANVRLYSDYSNGVVGQTPPQAPDNLIVSSLSSSQVGLSWTNHDTSEWSVHIEQSGDGTNFYEVASCPGGSTSFAISGLGLGATYSFRVRAYNGNFSDYSNVVQGTPSISIEAPSASIVEARRIHLSWYQDYSLPYSILQRSVNGGDFQDVSSGYGGGWNSVVDNGLAPSTTYVYRINAQGLYSGETTATTQCDPPISTAFITQHEINLTWNIDIYGGINYILERSTDGVNYGYCTAACGLTNYVDAGLTPQTTYYYRLSDQGIGGNVLTVQTAALTVPDAPWLSWSGRHRIDLGINYPSDYVRLELQRSFDNGTFEFFANCDGSPAYTDWLPSNTTAHYRLCAFDADNCATVSASLTASTPSGLVVAPIPTATSSATIDVSWSVDESSWLEKTSDGENYSPVAYSNGGSQNSTVYDLATGTTYYFRVATGVDPYVDYSDVVSTDTRPEVPNVSVSSAGTTQTTVSWSGCGPAAIYSIERWSGTNPPAVVASSLTDTTWTDTALEPGTTYCYRVIASTRGGSATSPDSDPVTTDPLLVDPSDLQASARSATRIDLQWQSNNTLADVWIVIEMSAGSGGSYALVDTVPCTDDSYTVNGLSPDQTYYFRLKAIRNTSDSGYSNSAVTLTAPAEPTDLAATTVSSSRVDLVWVNHSPTQWNLHIYAAIDGGDWQLVAIAPASATSRQISGLQSITSYQFYVVAYNGTESAPSTLAAATTLEEAPSLSIWGDPANPAEPVEGDTLNLHLDATADACDGQGPDAIDYWVIHTGEEDFYIDGNPGSADITLSDDGFYTITADAFDDQGEMYPAAGTINVTVANAPRTMSIDGDSAVHSGQRYRLNLHSSDPGDDQVERWLIQWEAGGDWETVNGNPLLAEHVYTSTGECVIRAMAIDEDGPIDTDQDGTSDTVAFTVTVLDALPPGPQNLQLTNPNDAFSADAGLPVGFDWDSPVGLLETDVGVIERTDESTGIVTTTEVPVSPGVGHWDAIGLADGQAYWFRVAIRRGDDCSDFSNSVRVATLSATGMHAPYEATVEPAAGDPYTARLTWKFSPNAVAHTGFRIYASAPGPGAIPMLQVENASARQADVALPAGLRDAYDFTFNIVAYNLITESAGMSALFIPPPAKPTGLSVNSGYSDYSDLELELAWTDNSQCETSQVLHITGITPHEVFDEATSQTITQYIQTESDVILPPNQRHTTLHSLSPNTDYSFELRAVKDTGTGSVRSEPQTATFTTGSLPQRSYQIISVSPAIPPENDNCTLTDQTVTIPNHYVFADTPEQAIRSAVQIDVEITHDPTCAQAGTTSHSFPEECVDNGLFTISGNSIRLYHTANCDSWCWNVDVAPDRPTITARRLSSEYAVENSASNTLVFEFARPAWLSDSAMDVRYVLGGTAIPGTDYTVAGLAGGFADVQTLHFAAGQSVATLTLTATADGLLENDETVSMQVLSGPLYRGGGGGQGIIVDAPLSCDIAVDSNNDGFTGTIVHGKPDPEDDSIEDTPGLPGAILPAQNGDTDLDGIPDFADGYNLDASSSTAEELLDDESFTWALSSWDKVVLTLPQDVDPGQFLWKLDYDASAPQAVTQDIDGQYHAAPGALRLWALWSDLDQRTARSFVTKTPSESGVGFFVPSGTVFNAADWAKLTAGGSPSVTLYLEGIANPTTPSPITFSVDPTGSSGFTSDTANVTVGPADLDVDSFNVSEDLPVSASLSAGETAEDTAAATEYIEAKAGETGKIIVVNDGDRPLPGSLNGNGVPDLAEGFDASGNRSEGDVKQFVPMVLRLPQWVNASTARIQFSYDAASPLGTQSVGTLANPGFILADGSLRVWRYDGQFVAPTTPISASDLGFTSELRELTLYVEAVRPSTRAGDLKIAVKIDADGTGPAPMMRGDEVAFTAIQAVAPDYSSASSLLGAAEGSNGGNPAALGNSGPVRFSDGSVSLTASDLQAGGMGLPLDLTRTWTSQLSLPNPADGNHLRSLAGWDDQFASV